jgi:hypothetical protein
MKFSNQAVTSLMMTLQKCLLEEVDIVELLSGWEMTEKDGEIFVTNTPTVKVDNTTNEPRAFETE